MALSAAEIRRTWRVMLDADVTLGNSFTKPDLAAAVASVDVWADANAASFNAAISQPFRGTATAQQKAILLAYVALSRTGVI